MFVAALVIGIYSYLIFLLGIFGLLYKDLIIFLTLAYFSTIYIFLLRLKTINVNFTKIKLSKSSKFLLFLIFLQAAVNLIGTLGPELSFDALWYHLTIPKIFLQNHSIFHIEGGLLYYSDMPKNIEMIYVAALSFGNEILAKFIHYAFGLLSVFMTYKISRKFVSEKLSLLSAVIFYSNLVVGWQSITAYVDLGTTYFTLVALYEFLNWVETRNVKHLIFSAVITGFTVATKVVSLGLIPIFIILIIFIGLYKKERLLNIAKNSFIFALITFIISLPWFMFSFINTGNPVYPILNTILKINYTYDILNIPKLFLFSQDPISPIYIIVFPLFLIYFIKFNFRIKLLGLYSALAIAFWFLVSEIGGSRFILPYVPIFSVLVVCLVSLMKNKFLKNYILVLVLVISLSSIGYRFLANFKYLPVVFGLETKKEFLTNNLNFSFGDFYDKDNYFKKNVKATDKVLLYGFHNLYYVDFPFIDSTWIKRGDKFNYIAVQNTILPNRFSNWEEIYYNKQTKVGLYSKEGKEWVY